MKKMEVGKTYKGTDGRRYIRVLKELKKYETYLCDTICIGEHVNMAYRTAIEYDETFMYIDTEDDFDEILATVPEEDKSHALKRNK